MYRALYEYKAPSPEYLTFCAGDQFTVLGNRNKDWFEAQNGLGQIGLIPGNYIKKVQVVFVLFQFSLTENGHL
jgi:hypothetical protein